MKNEINEKKIELRKKQLTLRKKLFSTVTKVFNKNIFEEFFSQINFNSIKVISSFISINSEIDTSELNNYIINKKKIMCLPVIIKKNDHLIFRRFSNSTDMRDGLMQTKEPSNNNEVLIPDLLFVPCLAYDNFGYRLGYGGGYYDRTFSYLKNINKKFIAVGYAFDNQKVLQVPKDKFDIKLDCVITEKKLYYFK